ncbi:MAG: hypothetical protein GXP39_13640 [Chloroflexi bacterium]|nr:hypothetical protein [Chloroflexota bacterium]
MSGRVMLALALGLGLALGLLGLLGAQGGVALADSGVLYVAPNGNCGGAAPCYATVQAAVDAAQDGDTVKIAQGTYSDVHARQGITQVVYITKSLTLRGGYSTARWDAPDPTAHPTILDAKGKGRVLYVSGYIRLTVQDLHITGGDATGLGGDPWGNDAGGGIFVHISTVTLRNLTIHDNQAYRGGGVFLNSSGGVYSAHIEGCSILSNTADSGAGLYLLGGYDRLERNIIRANRATWGGGGLFFNDSRATLVNNVIIGNRAVSDEGAGAFVYSAFPHWLHTTLANNSGKSGVFVDNTGFPSDSSQVVMTNTIISGHSAGIKLSTRKANTVTLTATLWHGNATNWTGPGAIVHTLDRSGDPAFAADGYHLTRNSAAIDAGVDAGVTVDVDGGRRPRKGCDVGADEYPMHRMYAPVILKRR